MDKDYHVRWMLNKDYPEVMEIERETSQDPVDVKEIIARCKRLKTTGMVCEVDNSVVGFMIYELVKSRVEVWRFAVHPLMKRMGVGSSMMNKLLEKLGTKKKRFKIVINAHQDYLGSHLFLKKFGFTAVINPLNSEYYTFSYNLQLAEKV